MGEKNNFHACGEWDVVRILFPKEGIMRKGIVHLVWGAFFLTAIMFSAPPASAQVLGNQKQDFEFIQTPGFISLPADLFGIPQAVKGIQKTINIPSTSFNVISIPPTGGYWKNDWTHGAITGAQPSAAYLQAPIIFPKGAKKIVKIDYLYAAVATGGTIALGECHFDSTNVTALGGDAMPVSGGWVVRSYTWATAAQPVILPTNQYFIALRINEDQALKAVILTYK